MNAMNTLNRIVIILVILAFILNVHAIAHSADSSELQEYLISGWRSGREKLVSGTVHIQGFEVKVIPAASKDPKMSKEGPKQKIDMTIKFANSLSQAQYQVNWDGRSQGSWVLTPEFLAQCPTTPTPVVDLINPSDQPLSIVRFYDPRTLGICGYGGFIHAFSMNHSNEYFEGAYTIHKLDDDRYRMEWQQKLDSKARRIIAVVNETNGFSIESTEEHWTPIDSDEWEIITESETKWENINQIWVPVFTSATGIMGQRLELTMEWDKVNEPFSENEFSYEKLDVPNGTTVVDRRLSLENPILIGRIGEQEIVTHANTPMAGQSSVRNRTSIILLLNLVLMGGLLCFILFRRYVQMKKS